jgi:hypothetical protein
MSNSDESPSGPVAFAALFVVLMSGAIALMLVYVRAPFGDPPWIVELQALLLLGAIVFIWLETTRRVSPELGGLACAYLGALVATLLLVPALGLLSGAGWIIHPLLGAAWIVGLTGAVRDLRRMPLWQWITLLVIAPLTGALYFFVINTKGYAHFLSPEFALLGIQHHDTMFHAAIASMLAKFGVVTTGLDGLLVPIKYHTLSHLWFGLVGRWLGISALHVYYLAVQIICIPLLFFALAVAVDVIRPARVTGYVPALAVLAPLTALSVVEAYDYWASYLVSESYLFSLVLFLLGLPIVCQYARRAEVKWYSPIHILFAVIAVLLVFAKISVGMIWGAGVLYLAFRKVRINIVAKLAILAGTVAVGIVLTLMTGSLSLSAFDKISPFDFFYTYPDVAWTTLAAVMLFFLAAAIVYPWMRSEDRSWVETLGVFVIASVIPALLLHLSAGAVYYFINVGSWIAIVFICATLLIPALQWLPWALVHVVLFLVVLAIAVAKTPQKVDSWAAMNQLVARLAQAVTKQTGQPQNDAAAAQARFDTASLREIARQIPYTNGGILRSTVLSTGLQQATDVLVYVPPEFEAFWKMQQVCLAQPFMFPAVFALPMLNGLPPRELGCDLGPFYGYLEYGSSSYSVPMTRDALCKNALLRDFARVLVVRSFQQGETIECRRAQ